MYTLSHSAVLALCTLALINSSAVCLARRDLQLSSSSPSTSSAQGAASSDFECGKPLGPCGSALPAGVTCPKGPGWCQAGHFCGWEQNTGQPSRCLPLSEKCGMNGYPCCPSNTNSPHTSMEDKLNRKPFCKDGATCFYFAPIAGLNNGDMFAGNNGAYTCAKVADDCGTGPGKPCCPIPYKTATNPPLKRAGCPAVPGGYCNYDPTANLKPPADPKMTPPLAARPGVCTAQAADCGVFGKACCVYTAGSSEGANCGPRHNEPGPKGYCRNPFAPSGNQYDPVRPAAFSELVCTKCPDKLDASVEKTNPSMWFSCRQTR